VAVPGWAESSIPWREVHEIVAATDAHNSAHAPHLRPTRKLEIKIGNGTFMTHSPVIRKTSREYPQLDRIGYTKPKLRNESRRFTIQLGGMNGMQTGLVRLVDRECFSARS
jgi:hypothetical protein